MPVSRKGSDETIDLRFDQNGEPLALPFTHPAVVLLEPSRQGPIEGSLQSNICLSLYATSVRFVAFSFFMILRMWTLTVLSQRLSS